MKLIREYVSSNRLPLLGAALVAGFTLPAGWNIAATGLSFRAVMAAGGLALGLVAAATIHRNPAIGLFAWVWLFSLGYRTLELTPSLRLHPAELMLWTLLILHLTNAVIFHRRPFDWWLPRWLWLMIPFWVWGWLPGLLAQRPWDRMLAEFRTWLLLLPLTWVTAASLKTERDWRRVVAGFFGVGTLIAGLGLLEYWFPDIQLLVPGYITDAAARIGGDNFARATFSFWGAAAASFVCLLSAPLAAVLWPWCRTTPQRLAVLLGLLAQVLAVYIGGYRSVWLLLIVQSLVWLALRFGPAWALFASGPAAVLYRFLPEPAQQRALSLVLALEGTPVDSSAVKRFDRILEALQSAIQRPGGLGWAGAGWTHSDFAQVAANLGVVAGVVFLGACLWTLLRLWRLVRHSDVADKPLNLALLLAFLSAAGLLVSQGVQVLPQLALPVWFVWVLVEVRLRPRSTPSP